MAFKNNRQRKAVMSRYNNKPKYQSTNRVIVGGKYGNEQIYKKDNSEYVITGNKATKIKKSDYKKTKKIY